MSFVANHKNAFLSVGWFCPAYASIGFLSEIVKKIYERGSAFSQQDLEGFLGQLYSPIALAAMVTGRYPDVPYVQDYRAIIAEAIEAHFMGLPHVAVSGLLPVVEGVATKLAKSRGVQFKGTTDCFYKLALDCKKEVEDKRLGVVDNVAPLLDVFSEFTREHLYIRSEKFWLPDKTNRHGILHGAYADADYGAPINFYKTISAIDVLCLMAAIRAPISWLAPDTTPAAFALANYYVDCKLFCESRPRP